MFSIKLQNLACRPFHNVALFVNCILGFIMKYIPMKSQILAILCELKSITSWKEVNQFKSLSVLWVAVM